MFTKPLDILIFFVVTTPIVGWVAPEAVRRKILNLYACLGLLLSAYFLYELYEDVRLKGTVLIIGSPPYYPPLGACLEIDMLSVFMAIVYLMIGLFVAVYSIKYMEHDTGLSQYYTLLLGMVAGMTGVAFAGDFFTLYIFWELMCLTSYALVVFRKERWAAVEAGFKYLMMSAAGSATILLAMSFLYGMTGTVNFASLASSLNGAAPNAWLHATLALLIVGFGIKAAIVPLHTWLPDAHPEAPSPVSALLSGVMIETGLYGLCRILFPVFSFGVFGGLVIALAVLTMTVGNFMALLQDDIKRLLAYSSIAQIGYMLMGVGIGGGTALIGTFLHVFNHALMKGLAFMAAGALWYVSGTRSLKELEGIGRRMPVTTIALAVSFFGLMGVPGTNGFISKFLYIFRAAFDEGLAWLGIVGIVNSVFSVGYYLRVLQLLAFRPVKISKAEEAPVFMITVLCVMALAIILLGVWPEPVVTLANEASKALERYIGGAL
ncbi:MAG: complex I subunit 5 family protein [Candidatus Bathyarchaeia archaeon]